MIGEATKAVDPSSLQKVYEEYEKLGVLVIGKEDVQIGRVKELA